MHKTLHKLLSVLTLLIKHLVVFPSVLCCLCLFGSPALVLSQKLTLDLTPISSSNELSQNTISCILKDRAGFMWFGTQDGLNKYDGYQLTVYKHVRNLENSITANHITCMYEDKQGVIWIGTRTGGLSRYDRKQDTFTNFRHAASTPGSLSDNNVNVIFGDHNANLWVGTRAGLNQLDPKTGKFKKFSHDPKDPNSLSHSNILALFEDHQHNLWVGSAQGLNLFHPGSNRFSRFIDKTGTDNSINAISEDENNHLWIGSNNGLKLFNQAGSTFTHFAIEPDQNSAGGANAAFCLAKTKGNRFWIGTNTTLQLFDAGSKRLIQLSDRTAGESRMPNDGIYALLEDDAGVLWIGTSSEGIIKYDRNLPLFPSYKASLTNTPSAKNIIRGITEDKRGNLYLATDAGLDYFNRSDNTFRSYRHHPSDPNSLLSNYTTAVLSSRNADVWIGTYSSGLNRLDPKTGRFERFVKGPGSADLNSNAIDVLLEDSRGLIWVGTDGGGVNLYDPASGTFTRFTHDPQNSGSICDNTILYFSEDQEGNIWIGGYSNGISIYNPSSKSFSQLNSRNSQLSSDIVSALHQDSKGNMWIGTMGAGLNCYDPKTKKIKTFTEQNGLLNNTVNYITEDNQGRLWLSTNQGITCYDPGRNTWKNFSKHNNLKSLEFNQAAGFRLTSGEIAMGGINGFNIIDPAKLAVNHNKPRVALTALELYNKPVVADASSPILKQTISTADEITLQYSHAVFTLHFAALDFTVPEKNNYAYMLEGFDTDWNYVGDQREATYTNLNPGSYQFRVKAANNDGVWSGNETTIRINITSPYWMTWWFKALVGTLIIAVAWCFYLYQISFMKKQRLKLERMVRIRTWKIGKQASDLQRLNQALQKQSEQFQAQSEELQAQSEELQMQSEELIGKTESLERLNQELTAQKAEERKARLMAEIAQQQADKANLAKSTFLATMSHEIRTPINGVMGMASLLAETKLDTEQQHYTEAILTSGESLLNVINDVLDFSKIESGHLELDHHNFELRKCVEDVAELFGAKIADSGIDLIYQIDEAIPSHIISDSHRLRQVLINMVSNAIKFTKEGEVFIGVYAGTISDDRIGIHFVVKDTGIGIAESQLANLFKSFNQLDSSVTRKYGGTGLGLVICERLVNLMGGTITVESHLEKGTSFTFDIYCKKGISLTPDPPLCQDTVCEGKRVLVVDDNKTSLRIISTQLEQWKLAVTSASSGAEALTILSTHGETDLVITDMYMPGQDGIELSIRIKSFNKNIPIILLNPVGDENSKTHPHLFSTVLNKPVKHQQLLNAVKSALKKENTVSQQERKTVLSEEFAYEYPFKILVAEDILINQKLIIWVLNKLGYQPDLANNGLEVLEMLKKQPYDLILMDVQMPQMDGLEATRVIRSTYGAKPLILALTANAMSEDKENCFAAGMDDYISKPINMELLTKSLKVLFKKHVSGDYTLSK